MSRISQLAGRVAAFWNFAVHGACEPVATVGGATVPISRLSEAMRAADAQEAAGAGFDFPSHARIPERPAHFGKLKEPPPPLPLPKDTANICTMVIREDLAFLRRIEEIRLTGGQPAVIDFLRQSDLSGVIAYAVETADANGELAGMTWLRAWSEGSAAAHAELLAYRLDEKPY